MEQEIGYRGNDLKPSKTKKTANKQECSDYCAATPGCLFWTWQTRTKKCYLKSSKAGRRKARNAVSGNSECGSPPAAPPPGCIMEQEIGYRGNDLKPSKMKKTANKEECADYSASTPGSLFWTWDKRTKKCFLKSSKAGREKHHNSVSGNSECGSGSVFVKLSIQCRLAECALYAAIVCSSVSLSVVVTPSSPSHL